MPLKRCSKDNKSGWKWGQQGHCYTGPGGKKKAIKQGYAQDPKHFNEVMKRSATEHQDDLKELIYDEDKEIAVAAMKLLGYNNLQIGLTMVYNTKTNNQSEV